MQTIHLTSSKNSACWLLNQQAISLEPTLVGSRKMNNSKFAKDYCTILAWVKVILNEF